MGSEGKPKQPVDSAQYLVAFSERMEKEFKVALEGRNTSGKARLLVKLFNSPVDVSSGFLPLRFRCIIGHARELLQHCRDTLEACFSHVSRQSCLGNRSSNNFAQSLRHVHLLVHLVIHSVDQHVDSISKLITNFDDLDANRSLMAVEWARLLAAVRQDIISTAFRGLKTMSDRAANIRQEQETRSGFATRSSAKSKNAEQAVSLELAKLLISLASMKTFEVNDNFPHTTQTKTFDFAFAEVISLTAITELRTMLHNLKPEACPPDSTHTANTMASKRELAHVLIIIIRSTLSYLRCAVPPEKELSESNRLNTPSLNGLIDQQEPDVFHEAQQTTAPSANALLSLSFRSHLVQLIGPLVASVTTPLLDNCISDRSPSPTSPVKLCSMLDDEKLRNALLEMSEELMLAEGEEQSLIGEWFENVLSEQKERLVSKRFELSSVPRLVNSNLASKKSSDVPDLKQGYLKLPSLEDLHLKPVVSDMYKAEYVHDLTCTIPENSEGEEPCRPGAMSLANLMNTGTNDLQETIVDTNRLCHRPVTKLTDVKRGEKVALENSIVDTTPVLTSPGPGAVTMEDVEFAKSLEEAGQCERRNESANADTDMKAKSV